MTQKKSKYVYQRNDGEKSKCLSTNLMTQKKNKKKKRKYVYQRNDGEKSKYLSTNVKTHRKLEM